MTKRTAHEYPDVDIRVLRFPEDFDALFPAPAGLVEEQWPPDQVTYLRLYLADKDIACKTIVVESHYVDRDFIHDVSIFYARSLRGYPNYCTRLHFFGAAFDQQAWRRMVTSTESKRVESARFLQDSYRGFSVLRPLPGTPIGRTVVPTVGPKSKSGYARQFDSVREYSVHLAGFPLTIRGLAFQQQDQGVSACATTALWSALHRMAHLEDLTVHTPAQITEAASRYFLDKRALPSEGLTIDQVCEATRALGLSPLVVRPVDPERDRAQLLSYMSSGFTPVLSLFRDDDPLDGHAVCGVGLKLGPVAPQTDPDLGFRDAATSLVGIYVHDDRLGPYAAADLVSNTQGDSTIRTYVRILWPDGIEVEESQIRAIIVPVPVKLRLTVTRMRTLGLAIAQAAASKFPQFARKITLNCKYVRNTAYRETAHTHGLSTRGLYVLSCEVALSRYLGVIEITIPDGPLFDVLLDATETTANPATLACVRGTCLPPGGHEILRGIASKFGARCIV